MAEPVWTYSLASIAHGAGTDLAWCDATVLESAPEHILRSHAMVYVLHLRQPLHHAKHYVGYAQIGRGRERLRIHAEGRAASSSLCRHLHGQGIGWIATQVQFFATDDLARRHERLLKSWKSIWVCPLCRDRHRERARNTMRALRDRRKAVQRQAQGDSAPLRMDELA